MLKLVLGFLMYAYGEVDRVCCGIKQLTESEKFWGNKITPPSAGGHR
jgi:hypothetical protein